METATSVQDTILTRPRARLTAQRPKNIVVTIQTDIFLHFFNDKFCYSLCQVIGRHKDLSSSCLHRLRPTRAGMQARHQAHAQQ